MATSVTKTLSRELGLKKMDLDTLMQPSGIAKDMVDFLDLPATTDEQYIEKTRQAWHLPPDAVITKRHQLIARSFDFVVEKASPKFMEMMLQMTGATVEDRVKLLKALGDLYKTVYETELLQARHESTTLKNEEHKGAMGTGTTYEFIGVDEGSEDFTTETEVKRDVKGEVLPNNSETEIDF